MLIVGLIADSTSMLDLRTIADWTHPSPVCLPEEWHRLPYSEGDIKEYQIQLDRTDRHYGISMEKWDGCDTGYELNADGGVLYRFEMNILYAVYFQPLKHNLGKAVVKTVNNFPSLEDIGDLQLSDRKPGKLEPLQSVENLPY